MILRPFWSYYGSAWRKTLRGFYPAPEHTTIVEPFAGAAGYSCHYPDRRVVLCDLDESVVTTWRYLLRVTPAELLALPDLPEGGDLSILSVCEEARLLMGWWCGRARPRVARAAKSWAERYAGGSRFWSAPVRQRLARQVENIRHWQVYHCSYEAAPVAGPATWFVDPPYQGKKGAAYSCSSSRLDFEALARWCRSRLGQVIVCEATGAGWLPFWYCGDIAATSGRSSEAVCVLRDGVVERRQLGIFDAR